MFGKTIAASEVAMDFLIDLKTDISEYIETHFGKYTWRNGSIHYKQTHLEYYTCQEKFIPIKPRNVVVSDVFNCPDELQRSWNNLKNLIRTGCDINRYRSNLAIKQNPDHLLYEWNISHLHFIVGKRRKDETPDNLLFCTFDEQTCYANQISGHGSFYDKVLLETVVRNWPHLVTEVPGIKGGEHPESTIAILRKKNINSFIAFNGKVYIPKKPSGFQSSGHTTSAYWHSSHDLRVLEIIKKEHFKYENDAIKILKNHFKKSDLTPLLVVVNIDITLEDERMKFYLKALVHHNHYKNHIRVPFPVHYGDNMVGL